MSLLRIRHFTNQLDLVCCWICWEDLFKKILSFSFVLRPILWHVACWECVSYRSAKGWISLEVTENRLFNVLSSLWDNWELFGNAKIIKTWLQYDLCRRITFLRFCNGSSVHNFQACQELEDIHHQVEVPRRSLFTLAIQYQRDELKRSHQSYFQYSGCSIDGWLKAFSLQKR